MKTEHSNYRKLWLGIGILILLAPIGLILPELSGAGGAWGEWGADELKDIAGYLPEGLKRVSELWSAPVPDYAFTGWDKGLKSYVAYIISGFIGALMVAAVSCLIGNLLKKRQRE
jgi:hypothetical protein